MNRLIPPPRDPAPLKPGQRSYAVEYTFNGDGTWCAVIDGSYGVSCVAQGDSVAEARVLIRGALGVALNDDVAAASAVFVEVFP